VVITTTRKNVANSIFVEFTSRGANKMNVYVWKGKDAWELATGNTPEEAAEALRKYFTYSDFDPSELELYDEIEETRSYYYGYVDPRNEKDITYPHPDLFLYTYGFQHPVFEQD
jgi:hypothetical protein